MTPRARVRTVAHLVACLLAASCTPSADDPGDSSTSTAPGPDDTPGSTSTDVPTGTAGGTSSGGDTSTGDPMVPGCGAAVPGEYADCLEGGMTNTGTCGWMPVGDATLPPTCLTAFSVPDGSVCLLTGCADRCDCFAPPATGTATVECMAGIVEDTSACVLHCGNGETCPDGMVCSVQSCVWP